MITVSSEREQVRTVARRWYKSYTYGKGQWRPEPLSCGKLAEEIFRELMDLDPETATPDDVRGIIGNSTWCEAPECDLCQVSTYDCADIKTDHSTVTLCRACLQLGIDALDGAK